PSQGSELDADFERDRARAGAAVHADRGWLTGARRAVRSGGAVLLARRPAPRRREAAAAARTRRGRRAGDAGILAAAAVRATANHQCGAVAEEVALHPRAARLSGRVAGDGDATAVRRAPVGAAAAVRAAA